MQPNSAGLSTDVIILIDILLFYNTCDKNLIRGSQDVSFVFIYSFDSLFFLHFVTSTARLRGIYTVSKVPGTWGTYLLSTPPSVSGDASPIFSHAIANISAFKDRKNNKFLKK